MTAYDALLEVVKQLGDLNVVQGARVRASLVEKGKELRLWVDGERPVDGRNKRSPLVHPKTGDKLLVAEPITTGWIEQPFQTASARLVALILAAYEGAPRRTV
jgi:hypothetical protein